MTTPANPQPEPPPCSVCSYHTNAYWLQQGYKWCKECHRDFTKPEPPAPGAVAPKRDRPIKRGYIALGSNDIIQEGDEVETSTSGWMTYHPPAFGQHPERNSRRPLPEPPAPSVEPSPEVAHDIHRMLPCPFCGSAADVCDPGTTERVACSNKECGVGRTLMRPEQWNRRAPLPSAPVSVGEARIAELEGALRALWRMYGGKGRGDMRKIEDALTWIGNENRVEEIVEKALANTTPLAPNPPPAGSETPTPMTDLQEMPCTHEWYQGSCIHCEISVKDFRAAKRDALALSEARAEQAERENDELRERLEFKRLQNGPPPVDLTPKHLLVCLERASNERNAATAARLIAESERDTARNALDQTRTKSGWDAMVKCLKEEKDKAVCEAESKLRSYYRDEGFKLELAESETRCVKEDLGKEIATLKAERDAAHARIAELEKECKLLGSAMDKFRINAKENRKAIIKRNGELARSLMENAEAFTALRERHEAEVGRLREALEKQPCACTPIYPAQPGESVTQFICGRCASLAPATGPEGK